MTDNNINVKAEEKVAEVAVEPEIDYKAECKKLTAQLNGIKAMYAKEKNIWNKTPVLTKMFKENGGNEQAVSYFLKLNSNLFKIEDEKELKEAIEHCKKEQSFFFNTQKKSEYFNASPFENSSVKVSPEEAESKKIKALFKKFNKQ